MMCRILSAVVFLLCFTSPVIASMEDYCQQPPTTNVNVAANILMVIDESGSMTTLAYNYGGAVYDSNEEYEGYFDPDVNYTQNAGVWEEYTGACGTGCSSGNWLNFSNMRRIDLIRWALTGGRPRSCQSNNSALPEECDAELYGTAGATNLSCDAIGCEIQSQSGAIVKARWDRLTGEDGGLFYQLQALALRPRIGSIFYSGSSVRGNATVYIGDFQGSADYDENYPYKNNITEINGQYPSGMTPLGPALWAARAYFAQNTALYGGPDPQTSSATAWRNPMYQCTDENGDGTCQEDEMTLVPCARNFIITFTDGQWNMGGSPVAGAYSIDVGFEMSSADPVVPAYQMHEVGFTNAYTGEDTNVAALYGLGLWLDGTGEQSLKNTAMFGGFDLGNNALNSGNYPSTLTDYPRDTCGGMKGSPCTALPASSADWDEDNDGVPDTFFSAANAAEVKGAILEIVNDILDKASSGTAVSMLSSSEGSGANLMQVLFYPKRTFNNGTEVFWTSDLMNYWYYLDPFLSYTQIREDNVREGGNSYTNLDLTRDNITSFYYDGALDKTYAYRWADPTGSADISVATPLATIPIEEAVPIWRGGFNLWWTDPADRNIFTSLDGSTITDFTTTNVAALDDYLGQTASSAEALATINYIRGYDFADAAGDYCTSGTAGCTEIGRNRTVDSGVCSVRRTPCSSASDCPSGETCDEESHVWKLGDIVSSTPRIMGPERLNIYNSPAPFGYNDETYEDFIESDEYAERQLGFVGANDGLFHAFRLGKLVQSWSGKQWYEIAQQQGNTGTTGIGTESYAFIPRNVLPYLQYYQEEDYCHISMVDGPTTLNDVSIHSPSTCMQTDYWNCIKQTALSGNSVIESDTSWRTVLIGSMGLGGATHDGASPDADRISTPQTVSGTPVGWSSYFALDVTDQSNPEVLWEFSNEELGVTNVGAGIVKVGGGPDDKRCTDDDSIICSSSADCGDPLVDECLPTNGRWFTILASGSPGPIAGLEFQGKSDQTLKIFILDIKDGSLVRTIDTGIANAFAGSISGSTLDLDRSYSRSSGNYQDDVIYISYIEGETNGGIIRLVIGNDPDPHTWTWSKLFQDGELGPITTSVSNLYERGIAGNVWLLFGEGRYFHKADDLTHQRRLYGVKDPCYNAVTRSFTTTCTPLTVADLNDQTTTISTTLLSSESGWYITMDAAGASLGAERVITNPTADTQGAVYFLSFAPTDDICGYGGTTYLWGVSYNTGTQVTYQQEGTALIQVSTGEIKEMSLSDVFTEDNNRKTVGFKGIPPSGSGMVILSNPTPIRKYMHVQEQ